MTLLFILDGRVRFFFSSNENKKHSRSLFDGLSPLVHRGLLIGGIFMDPKTAQTVTTVIMLTLMLVGGFYVRDVPVCASSLTLCVPSF